MLFEYFFFLSFLLFLYEIACDMLLLLSRMYFLLLKWCHCVLSRTVKSTFLYIHATYNNNNNVMLNLRLTSHVSSTKLKIKHQVVVLMIEYANDDIVRISLVSKYGDISVYTFKFSNETKEKHHSVFVEKRWKIYVKRRTKKTGRCIGKWMLLFIFRILTDIVKSGKNVERRCKTDCMITFL